MNPVEIQTAIEASTLLEPQIKRGIAVLIHVFHKTPPSTQERLNEAVAMMEQILSTTETHTDLDYPTIAKFAFLKAKLFGAIRDEKKVDGEVVHTHVIDLAAVSDDAIRGLLAGESSASNRSQASPTAIPRAFSAPSTSQSRTIGSAASQFSVFSDFRTYYPRTCPFTQIGHPHFLCPIDRWEHERKCLLPSIWRQHCT